MCDLIKQNVPKKMYTHYNTECVHIFLGHLVHLPQNCEVLTASFKQRLRTVPRFLTPLGARLFRNSILRISAPRLKIQTGPDNRDIIKGSKSKRRFGLPHIPGNLQGPRKPPTPCLSLLVRPLKQSSILTLISRFSKRTRFLQDTQQIYKILFFA
jgi:hypothetical protein